MDIVPIAVRSLLCRPNPGPQLHFPWCPTFLLPLQGSPSDAFAAIFQVSTQAIQYTQPHGLGYSYYCFSKVSLIHRWNKSMSNTLFALFFPSHTFLSVFLLSCLPLLLPFFLGWEPRFVYAKHTSHNWPVPTGPSFLLNIFVSDFIFCLM